MYAGTEKRQQQRAIESKQRRTMSFLAATSRRISPLHPLCRARIAHTRAIRQFSAGLTTACRPRKDFSSRPTNEKFVLFRVDGLRHQSFSTAPELAPKPLTLRSMVKPFLLKCHPDVQRSDSAREINLKAIQNLNSYLDTLQTMSSGKITRHPDSRIVEIDFVLQLEEGKGGLSGFKKKKKNDTSVHSSRRKVELMLPSERLCNEAAMNARSRQQMDQHSKQELAKLLKIAGLPIPSAVQINESEAAALQDAWEEDLGIGEHDDAGSGTGAARPHVDYRRPLTTHYERSRERFTANINWKKYDQLYEQAVVDMNADIATEGFVRDNPQRRRKMIATIVANVRVQDESIDVLEQLTAARRLSLLFEDNFDDLHLEDFGNMWENMVMVLTPSRDYNVSSTARYRRHRLSLDSGFAFTLHPDYSVTIHAPIDFQDDELLQELNRNLWDFYNLIGDGLEGLYPEY
jgi:hypothetical protein